MTEGIDTSNENDDLLIGFNQIYNDFYAKDISRKVRAGLRQKQKNKGLIESLPLGYICDRNTKTIHIDNETAWIVQEIFRLYLDGYGLTTIAKERNSVSVRASRLLRLRASTQAESPLRSTGQGLVSFMGNGSPRASQAEILCGEWACQLTLFTAV